MQTEVLDRIHDVLYNLHLGGTITDEDLAFAIATIPAMIKAFSGIRGMPEYDVAARALKRDLDALEGFAFHRDLNSLRP